LECPLCANNGHWHGSLQRLGSDYFDALSTWLMFWLCYPLRQQQLERVIDVDLPRPRDFKMLATARFAKIHKEVLRTLFARDFQEPARVN
jgi:hypothetical protein